LIDGFGWRSIFLINAPVGLAGIWLTLSRVEETEPGAASLDPLGQALGVISLCAITAAAIDWGASGRAGPQAILLALAGLVAAAAFLWVEARTKRPMLPLEFFRLQNFSPATAVGFVVNFTLYGAIFTLNLFLQRLAGYSPGWSGLAFLPFPVSLLFANLCAGPLVVRFGPRAPMVAGLAVAAVGFVLLSAVGAGTPWFGMLPGLITLPAGIGIAVPAMTSALLGSVPRSRSGVASGVLNTVRQAGGAMGVALFGSFFATGGASGMSRSFWLAAVLIGGASLLALYGIAARGPSEQAMSAHSTKKKIGITP
jgi:MFS transporter, DHA2 family, methylenomycin A resistance protein